MQNSTLWAAIRPWRPVRPQGLQLVPVDCPHNALQLAQLSSQLSLLEEDAELHCPVPPPADIGTATSSHNTLLSKPLASRAQLPPFVEFSQSLQPQGNSRVVDPAQLCCKLPRQPKLFPTLHHYPAGALQDLDAGASAACRSATKVHRVQLPTLELQKFLAILPAAVPTEKQPHRPRLSQLRPDATLFLPAEAIPALADDFRLPQLQPRVLPPAVQRREVVAPPGTADAAGDTFLDQFTAGTSFPALAESFRQRNLAIMRAFRPRTTKAKVSSADSCARPAKLMRRALDSEAGCNGAPSVAKASCSLFGISSSPSRLPAVVAPKSQSDLVRRFMGLKKASRASQKFGRYYSRERAQLVNVQVDAVAPTAMAPPPKPAAADVAVQQCQQLRDERPSDRGNRDEQHDRGAHDSGPNNDQEYSASSTLLQQQQPNEGRQQRRHEQYHQHRQRQGRQHQDHQLQRHQHHQHHQDHEHLQLQQQPQQLARQADSQVDEEHVGALTLLERFAYSSEVVTSRHVGSKLAHQPAAQTPRKTAQQTIRGFCVTIREAISRYVTLLHSAGVIDSREPTALFDADSVAHLKSVLAEKKSRQVPAVEEAIHVLLVAAELSHCESAHARRTALQRLRYRYRSRNILYDNHFEALAKAQFTETTPPQVRSATAAKADKTLCLANVDDLNMFSTSARHLLDEFATFEHRPLEAPLSFAVHPKLGVAIMVVSSATALCKQDVEAYLQQLSLAQQAYGHVAVILQLSSGGSSRLLGPAQALLAEVQRAPSLSLRVGSSEHHTVAHLAHFIQAEGQLFPAFSAMSRPEKSLLSKEERLFRAAFTCLNAFDSVYLAQQSSLVEFVNAAVSGQTPPCPLLLRPKVGLLAAMLRKHYGSQGGGGGVGGGTAAGQRSSLSNASALAALAGPVKRRLNYGHDQPGRSRGRRQ